jgi:hypothetical protein
MYMYVASMLRTEELHNCSIDCGANYDEKIKAGI